MTRFHVDLGTEPPRPDRRRNFKQFKSLAKAVRWAKRDGEEQGAREGFYPDIVDDEGNPVIIADWDAPEWMTKAELVVRLRGTEKSRQVFRETAEKLRQEQDARDVAAINAGFIPVRVLTQCLRDIRAEHTGGPFGADFGTTYTLDFQVTAAHSSTPDASPLHVAIQAISKGIIR